MWYSSLASIVQVGHWGKLAGTQWKIDDFEANAMLDGVRLPGQGLSNTPDLARSVVQPQSRFPALPAKVQAHPRRKNGELPDALSRLAETFWPSISVALGRDSRNPS